MRSRQYVLPPGFRLLCLRSTHVGVSVADLLKESRTAGLCNAKEKKAQPGTGYIFGDAGGVSPSSTASRCSMISNSRRIRTDAHPSGVRSQYPFLEN